MNSERRLPRSLLLRLALDALLARRRSFRADAQACLADLQPPLRVLDAQNIPATGPAAVLLNHYSRPGLAVWWAAMAVAASLPVESRWIITAEWTAAGRWYEPFKAAASRFASGRLARVYGFWRMPPMPPRPQDVEARARAVRAILSSLDPADGTVMGIAPEGADAPGGRLATPPPGAGRFLLLLAAQGLPFTPAGFWEDAGGALCLRFGKPFMLQAAGPGSAERDRRASEQAMRALAALLPDHLRGDFR